MSPTYILNIYILNTHTYTYTHIHPHPHLPTLTYLYLFPLILHTYYTRGSKSIYQLSPTSQHFRKKEYTEGYKLVDRTNKYQLNLNTK